ncbi:MAG: hypothetical protein ABL886_15895, partial [Rhodoglobus sp.]
MAGGTWRAAWDSATGVPSRVWGPGLVTPGVMASAIEAERVARQFLAEHIALLAPGSSVADFKLVSNHSDGETRSIGFVQNVGGRRVVGGQVSVRFKRDRLFLIGSEALPHVTVEIPRARLAKTVLHARATDNLRRELDLPAATVTPLRDEVILPLVADDAVLGYRLASPLTIDGGVDGRYLAYVDPMTGGVLAVHQQNRYASGTVVYRGVDRHPGRGRFDHPARRAHVILGGTPQTTSGAGTVSWSPDAPQSMVTGVAGDLVTVLNQAGTMTAATAQLSIAPGGQTVWDPSAAVEDDAQVVTYIATNTVKEYIRARIDPMMPGLNDSLPAKVNIAQSCNAFFDGESINFFQANESCQNTGLLEDVVYHEFGHALHAAELIEGVGALDGAVGEGAADFLTASVTNDAAMGRGFFYDDEPLRDLDPVGEEFMWPKDIGEIHH